MREEAGLPGDVVLYLASGKSALSSRLVAAGEILAGLGRGSKQYSHGAIIDHGPWQYEAVFPKAVHSRVDLTRPFEIWRFGRPTELQRNIILSWCREHIGAWYDILGVATAGIVHIPGTYYCTRWCGAAYKTAGICIGDDIFSPDSLPDTPGARRVYCYDPNDVRR